MWVEGRLFSRGYIAQSRDWFNNRHDELRPAASFLLLYPWERTVACGLKPYLGRPGYPLSPLHTLVPHPTRRICHASACATYCLTLHVTSRRKQTCNIACGHVWRERKHWVQHISIIVGDGVAVCSYTRRRFSVWLWKCLHVGDVHMSTTVSITWAVCSSCQFASQLKCHPLSLLNQ